MPVPGRWGRTRQPRPPSRCVTRLRGIRLLRLGRGLRWLFAFEHHAFGLVVPACAGVIALADAAAEHLARQRSFQLAADQALEFTRTELGLVAFFREMVDQRLIESERHAAGGAARHAIELQADDVADLLLAQRMEDDDLVDAVENSGRKWPRSTSMTPALVFSYSSPAAPRAFSRRWMMSEPGWTWR